MRKNRLHILELISLTISAISGRCPILRRVTVVWNWVSRPISRACARANMARSKVPGMPRKSSCEAASWPSTLIAMRDTPASLKLVDGFRGQQRRGAGSDVGAQADLDGVADQVEQVGPLERVAAGEHHQGLAEGADFVQQAVSLFGGQFGGAPLRTAPRRGSGRRRGRRPAWLPRSPASGLGRSSWRFSVPRCKWIAIRVPWCSALKIDGKFDSFGPVCPLCGGFRAARPRYAPRGRRLQ